MSATIGTVTTTEEINRGWGRYGWGEGNWGTPDNTINITGQLMTANLGQADPSPDVMLTGIGMTMNEGEGSRYCRWYCNTYRNRLDS